VRYKPISIELAKQLFIGNSPKKREVLFIKRTSLMIKMSIRIKPNMNAQKEFEQTLVGMQIEDTHISGLIDNWQNEKGCNYYVLNRENENVFCLESKWQSRKELEDHFRSKDFMLLMGAIDVLCEKPEVKINDGKISYGMEIIEAALGE